ncbi:uncharacterized protein TNCV_3502841 [Trichonephila clavipes]|uniref:Uncharacterized protein n=1 Tax=Trichonephila clavipes TaxID=2585209 RepID=A0A8X6S8G6_TRICX|nr:uncharacterized protein TNCV_3502841 [Trichonephila clavipes]
MHAKSVVDESPPVDQARIPFQHGDTLNSNRAASPLMRVVKREERWEAHDLPYGVLPQNQLEAVVAEWSRYRIVAGLVTSSSPLPLKTRREEQQCTLNLSRAETSSRWCGVVVRSRGCQLRCRPRHLTMVQNDVVHRQKPSCS